jgi:cytidine deaminase
VHRHDDWCRTQPDVRLLDPRRIILWEENERRFRSNLWVYYWLAVAARGKGISWRNFQVGSALCAFRQRVVNFQDHWQIFAGMNLKFAETERNTCSEQVAVGSAHASRFSSIVGMVIVGVPQADEKGIIHKTLRPCAHCRKFLRRNPLIRKETIIVTAHPPSHKDVESWDEIPHEIFTFGELLKEYGEV